MIKDDCENLGRDDSQKRYKVYRPRCENCGSTTMIRKALNLYLCVECGERTKGGV